MSIRTSNFYTETACGSMIAVQKLKEKQGRRKDKKARTKGRTNKGQ